MDNNGNIGKKLGRLQKVLIYMFFCFVSVQGLPSCSPKVIEHIVYQHDTTTVHHRDSLYFRDSIYVKEWIKGDTVYIEKFKDRYIYKDRWRDSISIKEVHDTTTVEKKVEKELTTGQKMKINSFWWLLLGLAGCLVWIFRKPILALIKRIIAL